MTRALKTQWHNLAFSGLNLHEILDHPLEDETPQARLKQVGMMTVIYSMNQAHQKLTLSSIMEVTALTRTGVKETVDLLVKRGMLNETIVKNSMGRGTARQFEISEELMEKLRSFRASQSVGEK
ncbi:MarR family transcriptional regulator [Rhizobium ruizarguesonis]|jgi:DNA-binding MarR family transcriptional regulator|uniref:MarR family transcriptional regulator n=1 Tax=Rhizobium ruizarguesonis TaxID=2081791 RepID=UPI0010327A19|nr:MarR family transcriptional regulator [Rhizobium ruizarguesonis]NEI06731.1 MarR family transcriptional regulator [Rhizobium ruizarguesonis]NEI27115.1 MarR family transcriptional regulator [Rhizobium ruizarguesonis]TBA31215.1 MarR family transcriptional regulator [Rhizobium ruizarguesonis]TBA31507.1 MarR family transcriptional regulator [Rhizobium ruizarguesonis]TBB92661.1 MarR family transcriptional regulator [Rhizobium ruizarguesonis]